MRKFWTSYATIIVAITILAADFIAAVLASLGKKTASHWVLGVTIMIWMVWFFFPFSKMKSK